MNVSFRKVGGLRFLKIGRLTVSFCVTAKYRPIKRPAVHCRLVYPVSILGPKQER